MMKKLLFILASVFLSVAAFAQAPVVLEWDASEGATSYRIYYNSETMTDGLYPFYSTTDAGTTIYVDETQPLFVRCSALNDAGESDPTAEIEVKFISTAVAGVATLNKLAVQAVESGTDQTITVTPGTNRQVTAFKIGDTWTEWPGTNSIPLGEVTTDIAVQIAVQHIQTLTGIGE